MDGTVHWIASEVIKDYFIRDKNYENRLILNRTTCSMGITDFQKGDFGTYILEVVFEGRPEEKLTQIQISPVGKDIKKML